MLDNKNFVLSVIIFDIRHKRHEIRSCSWICPCTEIETETRKKTKIRKRNFIIRETFRVTSTTHDRTRKCAHEVFVLLFRTEEGPE